MRELQLYMRARERHARLDVALQQAVDAEPGLSRYFFSYGLAPAHLARAKRRKILASRIQSLRFDRYMATPEAFRG